MNHRTDLVVLVADKDAQLGFEALLTRHGELGTRRFSFEVLRDARHDPGVYLRCQDFLRDYQRIYAKALVVFDHAGSGAEDRSPQDLESEVEERLSRNGWIHRSAALVLDPELEVWVWLDSDAVARRLRISRPRLRQILGQTGKPAEPKEKLEEIWRERGFRRSSTFYGELGKEVNFHRCHDRAFRKLLDVLQSWFPPEGG